MLHVNPLAVKETPDTWADADKEKMTEIKRKNFFMFLGLKWFTKFI